ncbi:MAG: hypothetical protein E7219_04500 [Clostridiales bacterium]|nr:hypothetical protein [Clostridiales bacterium]
MRKRLVIVLSIACVIAAAGIVLMCLDRDTEVRTADNKAAASSDALKIDSEPEFKEYSDIADPYERAAKIKADNSDIASDGYVISLKESAGDDVVAAIDRAIAGGAGIKSLEYTDRTYTCGSLDEFRRLVAPEYVDSAEPDFEVSISDSGAAAASAAPNDNLYGRQYNISAMNVPAVWDYNFEGQDTDLDVDANGDGNSRDDIVIAVIDSGLYTGHADIDETRVVTGSNFVSDKSSSYTADDNGHGTFVSGIIAAVKNNRTCIAGLLQDVRIMPLRVFDSSGRASMSVVTDAVNYAVAQKEAGVNIAVINMSLGGPGQSTKLKQACAAAMNRGIIVVCAAGNDYEDGHEPSYPAQYTMGVGSLDSDLNVSSFSQRAAASKDGEGYENKVWVTAPGEDIFGPSYSAKYGYRSGSGTSFACPEVAALAAICKSIDNNMTQTGFMELLKDTAIPAEGTEGQDAAYGWGKTDFKRTVDKLITNVEGTSDLTVTVRNEAGSEITGAAVTVVNKTDNAAVQDNNGVWTLSKKAVYTVTAAAEGYKSQTREITAALDETQCTFTLEGSRKYPVYVTVKDKNGSEIPDGDYSLAVASLTGNTEYKKNSSGAYGLTVGWYKVKVQSSEYYIDGAAEFDVDDMEEDFKGSVNVEVVLRRDAVGLVWNDHNGNKHETTESLVDIVNSDYDREYTVSEGDTEYDVYGISIEDLFRLAMSADEEIISAEVSGKRLKTVSNKGEAPETEDHELEDASVTISAAETDGAVIALVNDPWEYGDIMSEYNSMRLVIDGGNSDDWLYAPSSITITTKVSMNECDVSGITDRSYTGSAITQDPVVTYDGETLNEGTDYSISYANNIKAGMASVIFTGKGRFTGTKTVYFTISAPHTHTWTDFVIAPATEDSEGVMGHRCTGCGYTTYSAIARIVYPTDRPSVKISKPKAAKKKMTVRWKKVSKKNRKKIDGIEIQVSGPGYYQTFTAGKGKTSKKISGLARKQKYSVRIRAYKYIGGVKHVSKWSGWKTAKIK